MKSNTHPKNSAFGDDEEHAVVNTEVNGGAIGEPEIQDLAQLVWKYFEEEIREAMRQVQEEMETTQGGSAGQIRQRKQKRK